MKPTFIILADVHSGWFYVYFLLALPVTVLGLWFLTWRAKHIVRLRLIHRPVLTFDQWYTEHFGEDGPDKKTTRTLLVVLAHAYSVHPTQILPTDRFDSELFSDSWWSAQGMERELFEEWVEEATGDIGLMEQQPWTTVRELIIRIDRLRRESPVVDDDSSRTFTLPESLSNRSGNRFHRLSSRFRRRCGHDDG